MDKPLTRLIKKKRKRAQVNKIRNERGEVTTDTREIQKIVKNIMNNYMPTNGQSEINGYVPRNIQSSNTESGSIRKSQWTHYN